MFWSSIDGEMECPNDKSYLQKVLFHDVEADYCPDCLGMWFDKDELRLAKDSANTQFNWQDVDLWRDKGRFAVKKTEKSCPNCRTGLTEIHYDDSKTKIDFCKNCQGIWLDRGEFKQIMNYLKRKSDYELLNHYTRNAAKQLWEVFSGPGQFKDEVADFLTLIQLFRYKLEKQYPDIYTLIKNS